MIIPILHEIRITPYESYVPYIPLHTLHTIRILNQAKTSDIHTILRCQQNTSPFEADSRISLYKSAYTLLHELNRTHIRLSNGAHTLIKLLFKIDLALLNC